MRLSVSGPAPMPLPAQPTPPRRLAGCRVHQGVLVALARRDRQLQEALSGDAEMAADQEARRAIDSITRGIPSAPRPVGTIDFDNALSA